MILNLSVEVSDEIIELFGYSLYARNQKKSAEAEEVFNRLFSNLQSELKKEYQNTAQGLQALDGRLKFLETYSADAREVDRAINKLNNSVAGIDSVLNEYRRQQKNIADQMAQIETTVDQFYRAVNEDINKLRKDFATNVDSQVERLLKRILANNLHDTIKTSVDAVVKDYDFPAPDYSATIKAEVANAVRNISVPDYSAAIKAEVANAVRNISVPDYSAAIKAEVANAVRNISVPDYSAAIKAEVANAVRNISVPDYSATIKAEVANAVRNISVPDYSATIKAEVANAVRNISVPDYSATIRAEVANAVKLELQKTQASKPAIFDYAYQRKIDEQRKTIEALKKSIDELQGLVKALTARLSAIEEKSPATAAIEPQAEILLNIRDENSWHEYKNRLLDIGKIEQFIKNNPTGSYSLASKLSRIKRAVDKMTPQEFNEYTTETIVNKTVAIAKDFMDSLENCYHAINNPRKNSATAHELCSLIEEYLERLGVRSMDFKAGDNYEEWADLGMSETPIIEGTGDSKKHNTLKEIYVQPHFIDYLDEHNNKARRIFGGRCIAYAYKD